MVSLTADHVELSLVADAVLSAPAPDVLEVQRSARRLRLKRLDPGTAAALRRLGARPVGYVELEHVAVSTFPQADTGRLLREVKWLVSRSLVLMRCVVKGEELLSATATSRLARFDADPPAPGAAVQLSRFAYARREGQALVIESPSSFVHVEVHAPALGGLLAQLASPSTVDRMSTAVSGLLSPEAVRAAVAFLLGTGVLTTVDAAGTPADEANPQVAMREFHDVLMHAASRNGLTNRSWGSTFRFHGTFPPLPAVRDVPDGYRTPLPVPDRGLAKVQDGSLGEVMERRRSLRTHGNRPLSLEQLGEFLFRVARVDLVVPADEVTGLMYEVSQRPYPSGGAAYDLEFYLVVHRCAGLEAGIYHYDPAGHQLTRVSRDADLTLQIVQYAGTSAAMSAPPQVVVALTSRFGRLSWKYEGIAYATTLKNVGVLFQTMYLTATDMGLAACALGHGDSAVFAEATGLDPLVESTVGEFVLGSRYEE